MRILCVGVILTLVCLIEAKLYIMPDFDPALGEKLNADYWRQQGAQFLEDRFSKLLNAGFSKSPKKAKNIILFMGDGFGVASVTAARKYKQDTTKANFYENQLIWDSFPFAAYSKTYQMDAVVSDSAGTATAYLTGVKTRYGFIGTDASGDLKCESDKGKIDSLAHWAVKTGKDSGFVTTTAITHASPSPLYANIPAPLRKYQTNTTLFKPNFADTHPKCVDIAQQFLKNARHLKVAMGGGLANFLPNTSGSWSGIRSDNRDLVKEWLDDRKSGGKNAKFVTTMDELKAVDSTKVDYLLGLFNKSHLDYYDNNPSKQQPRLADLVESAIGVLSNNPQGFFLFVEGGRIDHGHHMGSARYALSEAVELDNAVTKAVSLVDLSETLIVVTADHSHTFSFGGALRHSDNILSNNIEVADDKKTFTSLAYANGPGVRLEGGKDRFEGARPNDSAADVKARGYRQQALVPLPSETHGAEDVPIYATGVYSELFSGVIEQSNIAWGLACAAGLKVPGRVDFRDRMARMCPTPVSAAVAPTKVSSHLLLIGVLIKLLLN